MFKIHANDRLIWRSFTRPYLLSDKKVNAASKGYISIVEYLLTESHANPLIKNNFGEAAYDVSAAAGESYICEMLHKAGKLWWQMQHTTEGNLYISPPPLWKLTTIIISLRTTAFF